jgi:hypothetical protein
LQLSQKRKQIKQKLWLRSSHFIPATREQSSLLLLVITHDIFVGIDGRLTQVFV